MTTPPSSATSQLLHVETRTALRQRVLEAQRSGRVVGLAAGVARHGDLVWSDGVGAARLGGEAPSADTRFQIASNTKTFVAAVIMALRDEGKLAVDAPLAEVLPGTPLSQATIRQLLSHSAGIQREVVGDVFDRFVFPDRERFVAELVQSETVMPPHTRFHYSNLGYALLGEVVARLDGGDWFASVKRRILDPLGMTSTTLGYGGALPDAFERDERAAGAYFVPPYSDVPVEEPVFDSLAVAPAAGIVSTPRDMARWGGYIADPSGGTVQILAPETVEEMCQPQIVTDVDRWGAAWGLGFMLLRRDNRIWVGHTGGWPGSISGVFTHRESGTTGVAMMNVTNSPDPAALATDLATLVEDREPEFPPEWTPGETLPPELAGLLGVWFSEGTQFTFVVEKGVLKARAEGLPSWKAPAVFEQIEPDVFRTTSGRERGEKLLVRRDADGGVDHMLWATYRFTREPLPFGGWLA